MYTPTPQDFANAAGWSSKALAQAQAGPAVPPPPDGPLIADSHTPLAPLPEGVTWAPGGTGAVCFATAANPNKQFFWSGALASAQKGSLQYAQIAYNTTTAMNERNFGWLPTVGRRIIAGVVNILTGLPSFAVDTQNLPGPIFPIPADLDTLEKAATWPAFSQQ